MFQFPTQDCTVCYHAFKSLCSSPAVVSSPEPCCVPVGAGAVPEPHEASQQPARAAAGWPRVGPRDINDAFVHRTENRCVEEEKRPSALAWQAEPAPSLPLTDSRYAALISSSAGCCAANPPRGAAPAGCQLLHSTKACLYRLLPNTSRSWWHYFPTAAPAERGAQLSSVCSPS